MGSAHPESRAQSPASWVGVGRRGLGTRGGREGVTGSAHTHALPESQQLALPRCPEQGRRRCGSLTGLRLGGSPPPDLLSVRGPGT